jgi:RND family efflux transporter MFP subunit
MRDVADTIEFVGTTAPTQTVDLRARVNGYLEKVFFEDGANVQAGQELFRIEQAPYQTSLDAARAALQRAVASLALAQSQYRRMEPLLASNVVTQEELDVQAAQVETSKADVAAAEAAVRQAELNLNYTRIVAPISGRIGRHMVDIGNLVQAEQTQLAVIQAIDPIYVYFDVSETDLLHFMAMLRNNELPDPDKNPPELRLGLPNEEGFPHVGHLDFRELGVNAETGTARRRGIFPNPGWQLIPGMFVRVQASIGSPKPRLLVDERAIGSDQRGDYLLVVNEKNVVEYRPVRLGIKSGTMRVAESGITVNDWVVVNGLQRARPGAQVKPEPASDKPAAEGNAAPAATPPANANAPANANGNAPAHANAPTNVPANGNAPANAPNQRPQSPEPQSGPPTNSNTGNADAVRPR